VIQLKSPKGQIFVTDVIVAVTLFTLAIAATSLNWNITRTRIAEEEHMSLMKKRLNMCSDRLIRTPGNPSNWEKKSAINDIEYAGLALSPHILETEKIEKLKELNDAERQRLLQLEGYVCQIIISQINGKRMYNIGTTPEKHTTLTIRRLVQVDGIPALLELKIGSDNEGGII
jgi:hypothetical protein